MPEQTQEWSNKIMDSGKEHLSADKEQGLSSITADLTSEHPEPASSTLLEHTEF